MRPYKMLKQACLGLLLAAVPLLSATAQTTANQALLERQQLAAMGAMDDWSCATVSDVSTRMGRLAYVWSVGYVTGRNFPNVTGAKLDRATLSSAIPFSFDESMVDAVRGHCLLNPDHHLGEMQFTPRQQVAMGRLFKILSSYRWADIAAMQRQSALESSKLTHRSRSVMMDGFIAGQFTVSRTANQIVKQGSAPWMCDAYEAMAANPNLRLREAAMTFYRDQANVPYHQAACARANFRLLEAAGQVDVNVLRRARQVGQAFSLPQAIDPGPEF